MAPLVEPMLEMPTAAKLRDCQRIVGNPSLSGLGKSCPSLGRNLGDGHRQISPKQTSGESGVALLQVSRYTAT
jgi:hypothetical protein